jgi:hypothetical protein
MTKLAIAPALTTSLSLSLAKLESTLAAATGSAEKPYTSGPTNLSDSPENGVPSTARRASVFFSTRSWTPWLRAFLRSLVTDSTSRPRYSATTIVWAAATRAETSSTLAAFSWRLRPTVLAPLKMCFAFVLAHWLGTGCTTRRPKRHLER